jgi:16S rRNA U1498 N3-methylase RsmE
MKLGCSAYLPTIDDVVTFEQAVNMASSLALVADQDGRPLSALAAELGASDQVSGFIGPPGGFSAEELDKLNSIGGHTVLLASTRLSTDIAAVALAAGVVQTAVR